MTAAALSAAPPRYVAVTRILHWLTVILVITTIPVGTIMVQEGLSRPVQDALYIYHKNIGPVILLVVILRIAARLVWKAPPLPDSVPPMQQMAAHAVHLLLYACLIVMPVSGLIRIQSGDFPIEFWDGILPRLIDKNPAVEKVAVAVHYYTRFVLILLILAHVGAAALHGIVKRDGVFSRMWPPV